MNFHGGNIYDCKGKVLDFSSNINPLGVPNSFKLALEQRMEDFTKYPDINYIELRTSIAEYLGVDNIQSVVPGNGAIEIIYRAIAQSGKKKVIGLMPTFSEYARAAAHNGLDYFSIDAYGKEYCTIDIGKIGSEAGNNSVVIICNPNNPTGTLVEKAKMIQLAEKLRQMDSMLIIDEAFMEFTPNYPANSMLDQLKQFSNVFVVKAATKFFGMPGIRLGYGLSSDTALVNRIRESMEPWNVNTSAVIAGCTVLKDEDYIQRSRQWIDSERSYVYEGLKVINEIEVYQSNANFHLVRLKNEGLNAWKLKERLLEKNILIRTPDGFEGLTGQYIRLAIKDRDSNKIMLEQLCNNL